VSVLGPEPHRLRAKDPNLNRIGSVGQSLPICKVEIVGNDGKTLPAHMVGEIAVQSDSVMTGYWGRAVKTDATLQDGWLFTGDVGYLDDDGYLFVSDRLKDMIITGGENVFSCEVENVISEIESVSECAVIGLPDSYWGEAVVAVIAPKANSSVTEEEVIDYCRQRIAAYKCPRRVIISAGGLPISAAGKIQKSKLRDQLAE
jgi:long-chain acyl-CoA synthetase